MAQEPSKRKRQADLVRLQEWLDRRKWEPCLALAEELLQEVRLALPERAQVLFAKGRSLSNLDRYALALDPAHVACLLAEEGGDYDLLGRGLLELAFIQENLPSREQDAILTLQKYVGLSDKYPTPLQARMSEVLYNLAVAERRSVRYGEALEHFRQAWERAKAERNVANAELVRQDYCDTALRMERLDLAAELLAKGRAFVRAHPQEKLAEAHLLADEARYNLLKGDYPLAVSQAMEAVDATGALAKSAGAGKAVEPTSIAGLLAYSLQTWALGCEKSGDPESAVAMASWGWTEAQRSQQRELIRGTGQLLQRYQLQYPDAVDRVMARMTGKAQRRASS